MLNHTSIFGSSGIRDRAIMETFYSTGVRRMELVGLRLQDFDDERGTLTIFDGKWKKDRVVPIGERASACLKKYLADVRPNLVREDDSAHIFLTDYGEAFILNRITDLVKKYMNACGIDKKGRVIYLGMRWQHICWITERIFGLFRRCWVMRTYLRRRFIPRYRLRN